MAQFSAEAIAQAIAEYTNTQANVRVVPGYGKHGEVVVYGENTNEYRPPVDKEEPEEKVAVDQYIDITEDE